MTKTARSMSASLAPLVALVFLSAPATRVEAAPEGQMNFAVHVTLAPKWLDPGET